MSTLLIKYSENFLRQRSDKYSTKFSGIFLLQSNDTDVYQYLTAVFIIDRPTNADRARAIPPMRK